MMRVFGLLALAAGILFLFFWGLETRHEILPANPLPREEVERRLDILEKSGRPFALIPDRSVELSQPLAFPRRMQ